MTAGVSAAEKGAGTTFTFNSYAIAELTTIGEFGVTRDDIDVTSYDSSGNAYEYIAGLVNGGELTCAGNLITGDTSGQMAAITACLAGTKATGTITLANTAASTWSATMHCKSYKITTGLKDALKISFVFKISGVPTWTV